MLVSDQETDYSRLKESEDGLLSLLFSCNKFNKFLFLLNLCVYALSKTFQTQENIHEHTPPEMTAQSKAE